MNQQQIAAIQQQTRHLYLSAAELAAEPELAARYVAERQQDAEHMLADLAWAPCLCGRAVQAPLYRSGLTVRHEIMPATLHAGACWGEIVGPQLEDAIVCATYACFMAYVLKKFG